MQLHAETCGQINEGQHSDINECRLIHSRTHKTSTVIKIMPEQKCSCQPLQIQQHHSAAFFAPPCTLGPVIWEEVAAFSNKLNKIVLIEEQWCSRDGGGIP